MGPTLRVLIVEDSEDDALLLVRELRRAGYGVTFERVDTPAAMSAALDRQYGHRRLQYAALQWRLTLTTSHDPAQGRVVFEVANTSPGIPPEIRVVRETRTLRSFGGRRLCLRRLLLPAKTALVGAASG